MGGYEFKQGICTPCPLGFTSQINNEGICYTKCTANFYCPIQVASSLSLSPIACPTGAISPIGSDSLDDCYCSDSTKIIDFPTLTCQSTYSGGAGCFTYDATTPDTCTKCRDAFRKVGKVCTGCSILNCATCDTNGDADRCLTA